MANQSPEMMDMPGSREPTIEESYFGTDRKPVLQKNGYAKVAYRRDDLGREIERYYYGILGEPIEVADAAAGPRCAKLVSQFDGNDKQIEPQCFDAAGMPILKQ